MQIHDLALIIGSNLVMHLIFALWRASQYKDFHGRIVALEERYRPRHGNH